MKREGQLKAWHIVLFAIAILLVLWQAFGYVKERRKMGTWYYGEDKSQPIHAPAQLRHIRERMEREK